MSWLIFPFSCLDSFSPSCTMFIQASVSANCLNAQQVYLQWLLSNYQKEQKDKKNPQLSLIFFESPHQHSGFGVYMAFTNNVAWKEWVNHTFWKMNSYAAAALLKCSLSFGKRSNTTPTQIKKRCRWGQTCLKGEEPPVLLYRQTHTCTHRNTGTTGVLCVGWAPTRL